MTGDETASVGTESQSSDNSVADVGFKSYQVSTKDLADFGINSSDDDGEIAALSQEKPEPEAPKETKKPEAKLDSKELDLDEVLKTLEDEDTEPVTEDETQNQQKDEPELELVRRGEKIKMKLSQAKDYAQKGFDYEVKSRELKAEREAFNHERSNWEKKIQALDQEFSALKQEKEQKEQIDELIQWIQETDQDAYNLFQTKANEFRRNHHNPYMEKMVKDLRSELNKVLGTVKETQTQSDKEKLRMQYYTELSELKELHDAKFSKYGIKMDEDAIQKEWIETGKPLKKIYGALYGDKLLSVADSKRALLIKQNAAQTAPTMGKVKQAPKTTPDLKNKLTKMSYSQIAREVMSGNLR